MKKLLISMMAVLALTACQSYDTELPMPDDEAALTAVQKEEITQITEDVNSGEVKNILGSLFGKQRKGRSADYTVSLLKDKHGVDRVICINYADNGGFALISAEKTHSPILAYADEGNFTVTDSLPFPLSEWMDCTMHSIAESESLPADSLETIARMWRKYDSGIMPLVDDYPSDGSNITWEEYQALTQLVMNKMSEWQSQGYRYYPINSYDGTTSLGDKNGIASYAQSIIYPPYIDEYRNLTFVVEKDVEHTTGLGHWMNVQWDQDMDFNQSFEFKIDNPSERIPVGCGPLAVGQIMYAYKYPTNYNWDNMISKGYGNKETSDFLLEVFKKCKGKYSVNTEYPHKTGTKTTLPNIANALRSYGYRCDDVTKVNFEQLLNNPAIIASEIGWTKNGETLFDDHAWIVEGGRSNEMYTTTEIWTFPNMGSFSCVHSENSQQKSTWRVYYINWGFGSLYGTQAYYNLDPIIPPNHKSNVITGGIQNIRPY